MRAFVIGNGPSLNLTNLNKIAGEVSFGVNNIHLIYPQTTWRPTHYVRAEEPGIDITDRSFEPSIQANLGSEIWCNHLFGSFNEIKPCTHYLRHFNDPNCPHLLHLPILCTFGSSVTVAIQIAMLKEYSPIYLVGCDMGNMEHFDKEYKHGERKWAMMDTLEAHVLCSRTGYPIFNATKGGFLETYERVDYDSLF